MARNPNTVIIQLVVDVIHDVTVGTVQYTSYSLADFSNCNHLTTSRSYLVNKLSIWELMD